MSNSYDISNDVSKKQVRQFLGHNMIRVKNISKDVTNQVNELDGVDIRSIFLKFVNAHDKVLIQWKNMDEVDDEVLHGIIKKCVDTHIEEFKNISVSLNYNYRVSIDKAIIGELLRDKGPKIETWKAEMMKNYGMKSLRVTLMEFDPESEVMYQMISFENQCEDVIFNSVTNEVTYERYGDSVLFICNLYGPSGIKVTDFKKEVIKFIATNATTHNDSIQVIEEEIEEE